MYASDELQFGLLPERKLNWRSLATSYGLEVLFILLLVAASLFGPSHIQLRQRYTVTELLPPPDLSPTPAPLKLKTPHPVATKLLPPALLETPKLLVPRELRVEAKPVEAPKVVIDTFKPVVLEQSGARQAKLLYTGSFGSAPAPTVSRSARSQKTPAPSERWLPRHRDSIEHSVSAAGTGRFPPVPAATS